MAKNIKEEKPYYELGKRIQKKRKEMGFKRQEDFYDFLYPHGGCTTIVSKQKYISQRENGWKAEIKEVGYIASKLGVSTDYLIYGKNKKHTLRDWFRTLFVDMPNDFLVSWNVPCDKDIAEYLDIANRHESCTINLHFDLSINLPQNPCYDGNDKPNGMYFLPRRYTNFVESALNVKQLYESRLPVKTINTELQKAILNVDDSPYSLEDFFLPCRDCRIPSKTEQKQLSKLLSKD